MLKQPTPAYPQKDYLKTVESLRFVEELVKKIETQDNVGTATPILICVQELKQSAVVDPAYHDAGVHGYDKEEVRWCYQHDDSCFEAFTKEEVLNQIKEYFAEDFNSEKDYEDDMILVQYKYFDVAWFLTHDQADAFIRSDKHNLCKPRKYVKHLGYKSTEMYHVIQALKCIPELLQNLDWSTWMIFKCSDHGLFKMMSSGIRHQYQLPNYEGVAHEPRPTTQFREEDSCDRNT